MNKLSFKNKIFISIFFILLSAVATSYFSSKYFIESNVSQLFYDNTEDQISLIAKNVELEVNSTLRLAENITVPISGIQSMIDETGFHNIVKILSATTLFKSPKVELSEQQRQNYLSIASKVEDSTLISDLIVEDGMPMFVISVPVSSAKGGGTDLYFIELSRIIQLIDQIKMPGRYYELKDSKGQVIYSNLSDGDYYTISRSISLGSHEWVLNGYIDHGLINNITGKINLEITEVLIFVCVILILCSLFVLRTVYQPILFLRDIVGSLATQEIDLTKRLNVTSNDDLGLIAKSINKFIENLENLVRNISSSNNDISNMTDNLNTNSSRNTDLIFKHRSETDMIVASVTEMTATSEEISRNSNDAAQLTKQVATEYKQTNLVVEEAVTSVNLLIKEVENTAGQVDFMSESIEKITSVLAVIGDIASQTNLLALNAAIEAARAGEKGRGFSVVADEVRVLAARTQDSTLEIDKMLEELKVSSQNAVSSINNSRSRCSSTSEKTTLVTSSLNKVSDLILLINDYNSQIAVAVEEQSLSSQQINENMAAIQLVVVELESAIQESNRETSQLYLANSHVDEEIARFKIS